MYWYFSAVNSQKPDWNWIFKTFFYILLKIKIIIFVLFKKLGIIILFFFFYLFCILKYFKTDYTSFHTNNLCSYEYFWKLCNIDEFLRCNYYKIKTKRVRISFIYQYWPIADSQGKILGKRRRRRRF